MGRDGYWPVIVKGLRAGSFRKEGNSSVLSSLGQESCESEEAMMEGRGGKFRGKFYVNLMGRSVVWWRGDGRKAETRVWSSWGRC